MYTRKQVDSFFDRSATRPPSAATEIVDTDFEDESEFEESSAKRSFESVSYTGNKVSIHVADTLTGRQQKTEPNNHLIV